MQTTLILPDIQDGEDKSCALKNRIRKNYKHLRKWAKRENINAFRIYERDIKEFPIVIDYYDGRFCVQYFTSSREESDDAPEHLQIATEDALLSLFNVNLDNVFWKSRIRRKKTEQYEKIDEQGEFFEVVEYGVKFLVNLQDYLDTGLFLDHRETRKIVASLAKDKKVLNLFAYTSAFSVHAAMKGASFTKSVDMSNTYTAWSQENFLINALSLSNNEVVRADCLKFLEEEVGAKEKYDLIIIDPPTLSRSKKMDEMFDIQEDYIFLIDRALLLLNEGGTIFFSTNSRKFIFEEKQFYNVEITEITKKTIPPDFRNEKIHRCWTIKRK